MLQAERADLLKKMQEVQDLSEDLKARLNSIFYKVGDRQALIKSGLVQDPCTANRASPSSTSPISPSTSTFAAGIP